MQWLFNNYLALSTQYLDEKLLEAAGECLTQVVFLAAGMDGRAYRLPWPAETILYELDKPELLTFKQEVARLAVLPLTARLLPIPADLREDWPNSLQAAGFSPQQPTLWLLEGILQYLQPDQANQLLAKLSEVSAPGSRLIAVYAVGDILEPAQRTGHDKANDFAAYAKVAQVGPNVNPDEWLVPHSWQIHEVIDLVTWSQQAQRPSPPAMDPAQGGAVCHLVVAHHL